jgi:phenylacetate-CoA ligase
MQAWTKVSRMPAPAIIKMQDELLQKLLKDELAVRHPYYRNVFKEQNIDLNSIKGAEDLSRLPFTEKKDMVATDDNKLQPKQFVLEELQNEQPQSKKKGFSLFGKKDTGSELSEYKFHNLYFTAGRTNKPVPIEYTHYDLDNLRETGARTFDILELTRDDTLINAFTYAPNVHFWQMFYSTIEMGSTALQTGGGKVLGLEKILKALDSMEAPVLAIAPGYARFALHTLEHFGFSAANLERLVIGTDYTPLAAVERLKKLMSAVGAKDNKVQRIYFLSEAKSGWAECDPDFGYHTNPDHVLIEIVDPESGDVLGEGQKGEIVITNLDARGTVVLRFRTGDIATGGLTTEPCPNCKRTVPRIMGDIERKALFYDLQGRDGKVEFNGNHLRRDMFAREDVLIWYAEINSSGEEDNLRVVFKNVSGTDEKAVLKAVEDSLKAEYKFPVSVETSSLDAIANKIGIEKFITEQNIFDNRSS